jgi:undecaprenyl-diphosphatase
MTLIQAIILGIVQGLTEFLPVSSTAHLVLFPWLLHWPEPGQTFDVALHAGTLIAVIAYFRKDWMEMLTQRRDLLLLVILGCVPAGLAGALFEKGLDRYSSPSEFHAAPALIAGALAVIGIFLYAMDRYGKKRRNLEQTDVQDALLIGIAQAFALFPGVSRSGSTMGMGLLLGLNRETAARFSFLLSAPIIAGAVALKTLHLAKDGIPPGQGSLMLWGIVASAITGYVAIQFLMNFVKTQSYKGFAIYRTLLGAAIFAIWLLRR